MFDNEFCKVEYLSEENIVYLAWKKFSSGENYRKPANYALQLLREHKSSNFIIDARNGFEDDKKDVEWGFNYLLPNMGKTTCKYCIMIMNEVNDIEGEMDMWTKECLKYFKVKHTTSYEEAIKSMSDLCTK